MVLPSIRPVAIVFKTPSKVFKNDSPLLLIPSLHYANFVYRITVYNSSWVNLPLYVHYPSFFIHKARIILSRFYPLLPAFSLPYHLSGAFRPIQLLSTIDFGPCLLYTITGDTYCGCQLIVEFYRQFGHVERSLERRHVFVCRSVLQFYAQGVRTQPKIVAEKQLWRVPPAGVGHWKLKTKKKPRPINRL